MTLMTRIYTDLKSREDQCNPRHLRLIHFFLVLACPYWIKKIFRQRFQTTYLAYSPIKQSGDTK